MEWQNEVKLQQKRLFRMSIITLGPVVQNLPKLLANVTLKFLSWNMTNILIYYAEKKKC